MVQFYKIIKKYGTFVLDQDLTFKNFGRYYQTVEQIRLYQIRNSNRIILFGVACM